MIGMNTETGGITIEELFRGKAVVVGIGNVLRGDDGLGPCLVQRLAGKLDIPCFNAESSLDRYVGRIARESPDRVVFVDATHLGKEPGSFEVLPAESVAETRTSTHDSTPRSAAEMLGQMIDGEMYLLGVQPENVQIGEGLSRRIARTVRRLERRITRAARAGTGKRE